MRNFKIKHNILKQQLSTDRNHLITENLVASALTSDHCHPAGVLSTPPDSLCHCCTTHCPICTPPATASPSLAGHYELVHHGLSLSRCY